MNNQIEDKIKNIGVYFNEYRDLFPLLSSVERNSNHTAFVRKMIQDKFFYEMKFHFPEVELSVSFKESSENEVIGKILNIFIAFNELHISKQSFVTDENVELFLEIFNKEFKVIQDEVFEKIEVIKENLKTIKL